MKTLITVVQDDEGSLITSIDLHGNTDPAVWGLTLVDIARHVASACGKPDAFERVMYGFELEKERYTTDIQRLDQ